VFTLLAGSVDRRTSLLSFRESVVKVTAVRIRYEHIAASWHRATAERRAGLLGELELLVLQLPAVQSPDDPDRAEVVALRAIRELITEITIGLADPDLSPADDRLAGSAAAPRRRVTCGAGRDGHHPQPVPGRVLDQDGYGVPGRVGVEMSVGIPHHPRHQSGVQVRELTRKTLRYLINRRVRDRGSSSPACRTSAVSVVHAN
jgi:hypothetical protein